MTSSDSGLYEFARIYPDGLEAEIALDLVAANEKLHPQHAFFLHTQEKIRSDESDLELSPSERREPLKRTFLSGYYKLSLDDPVEQPFAQGYLAGRGHSKLSRDGTNEGDLGVHLLLLRRGRRSNGVAAVHARISIHRRSGALMLFGVQEKRPVLYRIHDDSTVSLEKGQGHVLYQKNNSFTVGNLSYRLVFSDFTHEQYLSFLEKRNQVMEAGAFLAPHPSLSAVWRYQDSKKGYVITHGTIAVGRFGWVRAAVDTRTGEPLAVKRQEAKSKYDMEKIEKEHKVGLQFNVSTQI